MGNIKYFKKEILDKNIQQIASANERCLTLCEGVAGKIVRVDDLVFNREVYLNNMEVPYWKPYWMAASSSSSPQQYDLVRLSNLSETYDSYSNAFNTTVGSGSGLGLGSGSGLCSGLGSKQAYLENAHLARFLPQYTSLSIVKRALRDKIKSSGYFFNTINISDSNKYSLKQVYGLGIEDQLTVRTFSFAKIDRNYRNIHLLPDECLIVNLGLVNYQTRNLSQTDTESTYTSYIKKINMIVEGHYTFTEVPYESKNI